MPLTNSLGPTHTILLSRTLVVELLTPSVAGIHLTIRVRVVLVGKTAPGRRPIPVSLDLKRPRNSGIKHSLMLPLANGRLCDVPVSATSTSAHAEADEEEHSDQEAEDGKANGRPDQRDLPRLEVGVVEDTVGAVAIVAVVAGCGRKDAGVDTGCCCRVSCRACIMDDVAGDGGCVRTACEGRGLHTPDRDVLPSGISGFEDVGTCGDAGAEGVHCGRGRAGGLIEVD